MDVYFYHLERSTLEQALPLLLERTLEKPWRAFVRTGSLERAQALDAALWTYKEESFLPHGLASEPNAHAQPILISDGEENKNRAQALYLVDGSAPSDWIALSHEGYERAILIFDGNDATAVDTARAHWRAVKAADLEAAYWQQTAGGKWEKKN
jgi:DNA polymerase-3 subunit chi